MPLLIPFDPSGLEAKTVGALDDLIAALQTWANQVDGVNAAERLTALTTGIASLPTVPTGVKFDFFGTILPVGYLWADGSPVSRTTYATLFAAIGTTYGAGNGTTTFNVPDCRQKYMMGKAASGTGATLGSTFGAINHTHTGPSHTHTGPSHTHSVTGSTASANISHAHAVSGRTGDGTYGDYINVAGGVDYTVSRYEHTHSSAGTDGADSPHTHGAGTLGTGAAGTGATGADGTGATGTNNPPTLVCNVIVKT